VTNIVEVDFKIKEPEKRLLIKNQVAKKCSHLHVEIDTHFRLLECVLCGKKIDAFDFIINEQEKEHSIFKHLTQLYCKKELLQQQIADLEREQKKLLSKIKIMRLDAAELETKTKTN